MALSIASASVASEKAPQRLRLNLLLISLACCLLFGGALAISFIEPLLIERAARELVRLEVERRVGHRVEALSNSRMIQLAQKSLAKVDVDIDKTRREIAEGLPRKVAETVANMLDADCECRKRLLRRAVGAHDERLSSLGQLRHRLEGLIESAYQSVSSHLLREFRIFTAANSAAFALLAMVTWLRRGAALQILLPAAVLVCAVLLTGGLYLFKQDWLHTLLYSDYVGWTYFGYLAAAALLLADVVFNRARLTTRVVNEMLHAVGSAVQAVPC
jgi:hypothetical protein